MDQEGRRHPERDQVGQRIELAAERALHAAHSRDAAIEQIEDAGQQDETQRDRDFLVEIPLINVCLDDFCQRHEAAEKIPGGEQVRKEIDFDFPFGVLTGRRDGGRQAHGASLKNRQHCFAASKVVAEFNL